MELFLFELHSLYLQAGNICIQWSCFSSVLSSWQYLYTMELFLFELHSLYLQAGNICIQWSCFSLNSRIILCRFILPRCSASDSALLLVIVASFTFNLFLLDKKVIYLLIQHTSRYVHENLISLIFMNFFPGRFEVRI